ncbi:MAG: cytochrome P450 [Cyanophyceae cyanobacterium]
MMVTTTSIKAKALPKKSLWQNTRLLLKFRRQPLETLRKICDYHGDLVNFEIGNRSIAIVRDPEYIEQILVRKRKNFTKNTPGYKNLKLLLGEGLLTSEGDFWVKQRRMAQPSFHRETIAGFAEIMTQATKEFVFDWKLSAKQERVIDVSNEMQKLTLKIIGLCLLSVDLSDEAQTISQVLPIVTKYITNRVQPIQLVPDWLPNGEKRQFQKAVAECNRVVYEIINQRKQQQDKGRDLLGMFLEMYDEETGERMSEVQVRDEVMTMFLAGHETTASSLSWTFYLIARHPQIEADLRAELRTVLGDRLPSLSDLSQLQLLDRVIKESMRLYPPLPLIARKVETDDVVGDYHFPARMQIIVSSYVTHRHPKYWDNPDRFDPDRFLSVLSASLPRSTYIPFSDGAHRCIGDQFALMEMKLVLATILQHFKLSLSLGQKVAMDPNITLRPKDGLPMLLQPLN